MNNNKRVGFVGPYSTANLGDYAMLVNNIYDISCRDVTVFSYSSKFPRVSLSDYCENYNVDYFEVLVDDDKILVGGESGASITPLELIWCVENKAELEQVIERLDVVVVSGGGWINHFWAEQKNKLFKIMAPLIIARKLGKNIVFTANGVGPFDKASEFYRYFFRYIEGSVVGVRDDFMSPIYLSDVGVRENSIHHIPDDLFCINEDLLAKPRTFFPSSKRYIVMEMFYPMEVLEAEIGRVIRFSEIVKSRYDLDIVFMPFDLVFYGMDQAQYLHENVPNSELVDIRGLGFLPIQDAFYIIKNAEIMLSSRYHGLVVSLAAGTPVVYRTLPTSGDMRYSYSKAVGLLRTVFDGISVDEESFLVLDLISSLEIIERNCLGIIDYQKGLIGMSRYKENKVKLAVDRKEFIEGHIL